MRKKFRDNAAKQKAYRARKEKEKLKAEPKRPTEEEIAYLKNVATGNYLPESEVETLILTTPPKDSTEKLIKQLLDENQKKNMYGVVSMWDQKFDTLARMKEHALLCIDACTGALVDHRHRWEEEYAEKTWDFPREWRYELALEDVLAKWFLGTLKALANPKPEESPDCPEYADMSVNEFLRPPSSAYKDQIIELARQIKVKNDENLAVLKTTRRKDF